MKVLIMIPAYNESGNIENVVNNLINNFPQYDYVIINDGSTDNTADICRKNNYNFINLPANLGIGGCVQTGYLYASQNNYDIAIQMDGDGQHLPQEIEKIIKPIEDDEADFVIGSRFIDKEGFQSSITRRIGIRIISNIIKFCCGVRIHDTTSGFRAVNKKCIEIFKNTYAPDYPEPESIVVSNLCGCKVKEVPVIMAERQAGTSSINLRKSIYYMIKVSISLLIQKLIYRSIDK